MGSTAGGTSVASGATLDLAGQAVGTKSLSIAGAGIGGNGALVNSGSNVASLAGTVTANAAFTVGGTGDITFGGSVNSLPAFVLTKVGNNTLTLSGTTDNSNLGATVNSGTLVLAKTSSHSPDIHAIGQATLTAAGGVAQLGGTGGDQIYDQGAVSVTSGAFDTNGRSETVATLSLQGTGISGAGGLVNSAAAASTITPTNGTTLTANSTIGVTQSGGALTLNNAIGGNFNLTKTGLGTLSLSGNNTFSGGLVVQSGTLLVSAFNDASTNGQLGNNTSVTLGSSGQTGTLLFNNPTTSATNMPFVLASGGTGDFNGFGTLNGVISGGGGLVVEEGPLTLTANNTFTGGLTVQGCVLQIPVVNNMHTNGPLGNNASVTLRGSSSSSNFALLEYTGSSAASSMPFTLGAAGGLGIAGDFSVSTGVNLTLNGVIAGSGGLAKQGPGTLTLAANNTFSGNLRLGFGSGFDGGTLTLSGKNVFGGGTTVDSGTLNTTVSGSLGPGPLAIGADSGVTSAVNLGNSQTVSSLTGVISGNGVATLSVGSGTTLTDDQSFGDTNFQGTLINSGTFAKSGISLLEINSAPTLNANSAIAINGGKLRFNYLSFGIPMIGTGVTATVASGASLELAGSYSALSSGVNRVNIMNNSSPAGLLVSGTQQHVGNIDGNGSTQINIGGALTANHIIQSALVIGGTTNNPGLVTIDASDASGNSLGQAGAGDWGPGTGTRSDGPLGQPSGLDSYGFLSLDGTTGVGEISSADLGDATIATPSPLSSGSHSTGSGQAVPEPSALLLVFFAILCAGITKFARHGSCQQRVVPDWIIAALVWLLAAMLTAPPASASTWTGSAGNGLWNTSGNWSGGVPNATGAVADFSTLNIMGDDTVHMNGLETVGTLLFGDTMPSNNWILDNNNNPADILTLAVSSGSPTITVNNDVATISAVVAGSQGLTKNGAGTLVLSGNDTYSGTTAISVGTLVLGNVNALGSTAAGTTITSGATLDLGGQAVGSEALTISGSGVAGSGALINSSASAASLAGTVTGGAAFTVGGSGDITLSGSVNSLPAFVLTKVGNNTLTLSGNTDNSNLGATVNGGTLVLAKTSSGSPAVHAIGQATLTVSGGVAQLGGTGGDQIFDLGNVTVTSGTFDTNGRNETFATLSLQGTGIANHGALRLTGFNTFSTITPTNGTVLTGNATIGVDFQSSSIILNNAVSGNFAPHEDRRRHGRT